MSFKDRLFARIRQGFRSSAKTPTVTPVSRLSLSEYKALVASLPTPTPLQMQQFAEFVSGAHSWYKHLPLLPPGAPLQVFIDPAAGMQLVRDPGGYVEATHRTERGFHYSWLPTIEYRERFGYLAFSRSSGTTVAGLSPDSAQLIGSDDSACAYDQSEGRLRPVPEEVLNAGRAKISGIVHTLGADHRYWQWVIDKNVPMNLPEAVVDKIRDRCRELIENPSSYNRVDTKEARIMQDFNLRLVDLTLYEILEDERRRQKKGLVTAMQQVVQLATC